MERLFLIVRIAGELVAIDAERVSSVVEVDAIAPIPRVPPHIAGLFALRSRVLTVIDSPRALGLPSMGRPSRATAVIVTADGHGYALLVDEIVDVASVAPPAPCAALLEGGWARATIGQVTTGDGTLLLLDPDALIAGCEVVAA